MPKPYVTKKPIYKPSQILRMARAGKIADPQPKGSASVRCHLGHDTGGDTESPTFWENGSYIYCEACGKWTLARPEFENFVIDLSGERKRYPLRMVIALSSVRRIRHAEARGPWDRAEKNDRLHATAACLKIDVERIRKDLVDAEKAKPPKKAKSK